jgi:Flp pilus assembly pilin Flp
MGKVLGNQMTVNPVLQRLEEVAALSRREDGQALVEYALLLSLIMLAAFAAAQAFGLGVSGLFSTIVANYP